VIHVSLEEKQKERDYSEILNKLEAIIKELKDVEATIPLDVISPELKEKRQSILGKLEQKQKEASYSMSVRLVRQDDLDDLDKRVQISKKLQPR
jgi:hypothetical protein